MLTSSVITPSFYVSSKDLNRSLTIGIDLLKSKTLQKDSEGFCLVDDVCNEIKKIDPSLSYINRNHVIELFFKDKDRKVLVSGLDRIKYKEVKYVQPPEILYFGTVDALAPKMKINGIHSSTKGYIKLYDTPERACEFAKKFAREGDKVVSMRILALSAFSDGLKFSTHQPGEFIVVQIQKIYIE